MTAPVDRAYVEILPVFKDFGRRIKEGVVGPVTAAGKEAEKAVTESAAKMNREVAASTAATGKKIAETEKAVGASTAKVSNEVAASTASAGKKIAETEKSAAAGVKNVAERSKGMFSGIIEGMKGLFISIAPMAAGFGLFELVKGGIAAAAEQNKANRDLAQVLKTTGHAAHITMTQINELTNALSVKTGVDHAVISGNESLLLTFTNIRNEVGKGNDIFNQASAAVLDMSARFKEDGKSASIQLGKALSDPIKGVTALTRVGVTFNAQEKEQIKTMIAHHNILGAQKIILHELAVQSGGAAEAQASWGSKMKAAYHEVEVAIGEKLMPVIGKFSKFMVTTLIPAFMKMFDAVGSGEGTLGAVGKVMGQLITIGVRLIRQVIMVLAVAWKALEPTVQEFARILVNDILPAVQKFADALGKNLVQAFQSVGSFIQEHKVLVQSLAIGFTAAYVAIKLYTLATKAWAVVTKIAAAAQALWDAAFAASGIGTIIVLVVGLTVAIIYAYKHSKTFRDIVDSLGRTLAQVGKDIYQFFINLYHVGVTTWHALKEFGLVMAHVGSNIYQFFINLYHVGVAVFHAIDDAWHAIVISWHATLDFFKRTWNEVWAFIKTWGPLALVALVPFIGIPLLIAKYWKTIVGFIKTAWNAVWAYMKTIYATAMTVLKAFLALPLYIYKVWQILATYFVRIWSAALTAVKNGVLTMLAFVGTLQGKIQHIFAAGATWLVAAGHAIINGFVAGLRQYLHFVTEYFGAIAGLIIRAVNATGDWAKSIGRNIINGLWSGLQSAWNAVVGWFGKIPGWIKAALGIKSPPAWAVDAGGWIIKGLIKGLTGGSFSFGSFLAHFASIAKKRLSTIIGSITSFFGGGGGRAGSAQLMNWISAAEKWTGVGSGWTNPLITLIMRESGGNPNSINRTDINAQHGDPSRGLMQTIGSTFAHYRDPRLSNNIYDPVANIVAGIKYILARYGSIFNVQQANPNLPPKGYRTGAWEVASDQLAYLHRKEMVVPAEHAERVRRGATGGMDNVNLLARAFATALAGMAIEFDADGFARFITRKQALSTMKGTRR